MNRRIAVLVAAAIVVSPITAFARVEAAVAAEAVAAQPEARQAAELPREQRAAPQTTG